MKLIPVCDYPICEIGLIQSGIESPIRINQTINSDPLSNEYNPQIGGDFMLSAMVAGATDSFMAGYLFGGSFSGAILGDLLNGGDIL